MQRFYFRKEQRYKLAKKSEEEIIRNGVRPTKPCFEDQFRKAILILLAPLPHFLYPFFQKQRNECIG